MSIELDKLKKMEGDAKRFVLGMASLGEKASEINEELKRLGSAIRTYRDGYIKLVHTKKENS